MEIDPVYELWSTNICQFRIIDAAPPPPLYNITVYEAFVYICTTSLSPISGSLAAIAPHFFSLKK